MIAERRLTEKLESEGTPEMVITYVTDEGESKVEYYAYDTNYYAVQVDRKTYLVNKMTIKSMFEACETLFGMEEEGESKVEYYAYDTNYYAVQVDRKTYLVNKMTIKSMFEACETLFGMEEE